MIQKYNKKESLKNKSIKDTLRLKNINALAAPFLYSEILKIQLENQNISVYYSSILGRN